MKAEEMEQATIAWAERANSLHGSMGAGFIIGLLEYQRAIIAAIDERYTGGTLIDSMYKMEILNILKTAKPIKK